MYVTTKAPERAGVMQSIAIENFLWGWCIGAFAIGMAISGTILLG